MQLFLSDFTQNVAFGRNSEDFSPKHATLFRFQANLRCIEVTQHFSSTILYFLPACVMPPNMPPNAQRNSAGKTPGILVNASRFSIMETATKIT